MWTRPLQESFWRAAHKLKPQPATMLLLAVKKLGDVSWDIVLSLLGFGLLVLCGLIFDPRFYSFLQQV